MSSISVGRPAERETRPHVFILLFIKKVYFVVIEQIIKPFALTSIYSAKLGLCQNKTFSITIKSLNIVLKEKALKSLECI